MPTTSLRGTSLRVPPWPRCEKGADARDTKSTPPFSSASSEIRGERRSLREDVEAWAAGDDFSDGGIYTMASPTSLPSEEPTGRRLQQVKEMVLRVHRASGHSSLDNLSRLLLRRFACKEPFLC